MLDEAAFQIWCLRLGLSEAAVQMIQRIRSSAPARRVQGRRGNVCGTFPSRKMGHTVQYESLTNELSAIYLMEYDEAEVQEYWDQPPSFKLQYQTKAGVNHGHWHTPDFFVLRQDRAGWEEWKLADELTKLAEQMPARYCYSDEAGWHCPPGQAYAQQFGLYYRLRSSAEINWELQRNLRFLEDYLRAEQPQEKVSAAARSSVQACLATQPGLTLAELCNSAQATADEIFLLLVAHEIFVDLRAELLTTPEQVRVYPDQAIACAFAQLAQRRFVAPTEGTTRCELAEGTEWLWDGKPWQIVNVGQTQIALLDAEGGCRELPRQLFEDLIKRGSLQARTPLPLSVANEAAAAVLRQASPTALREATRRYQLIEPVLNRMPADATVPARTRQRWLRQYRAAQATHGMGYLGLLPRPKGNTNPKLPAATRELMERCISEHYETLKQKGKFAVYGQFLAECERQGIEAASYKTFASAIQQRPQYEQTLKRKGPRAAYAHEPFYYELDTTIPRHGERPFEIVHIDHTELDVELICLEPRRALGRPWATFLTDAFSRRLLAVLLLYDPPSYRTNMMILRECVRRHQRFPQAIVVDGGKDFHSLYFDALLAAQECTKRIRPLGKARFGSVIERLFGVSNQQFVHHLQGNTQITKQVRQVTKSIAPVTQAIWTLPLLYEQFCTWAYEFYDTSMHGTLGQSPRTAFERGMQMAGGRLHRLIQYDEAFRLLTLPTTRRGTAKVAPGSGVKINNRYFWTNAFRNAAVAHQRLPVRYDPYDAGQAYVFLHGAWVICYSEHYQAFRGRTEKEVMQASSELRKRHSRDQAALQTSAKQLAAFLSSVEAQESLLLQRLRDSEAKKVMSLLEGEKKRLQEELPSPTATPALTNTPSLPTDQTLLMPADMLAEPELYAEY